MAEPSAPNPDAPPNWYRKLVFIIVAGVVSIITVNVIMMGVFIAYANRDEDNISSSGVRGGFHPKMKDGTSQRPSQFSSSGPTSSVISFLPSKAPSKGNDPVVGTSGLMPLTRTDDSDDWRICMGGKFNSLSSSQNASSLEWLGSFSIFHFAIFI